MTYEYIKNIDTAEISSNGTMQWFESNIEEVKDFIVKESKGNNLLKYERIETAFESLNWLDIRYEQLKNLTYGTSN